MPETIWRAKAVKTKYPSLTEDAEVDVAIVGGGITGITTAYLLSISGQKVALFESYQVGCGTTAGSTGNLYTMVDSRLHHVQAKFNDETAAVVAESRTAAVDLIENLVQKYEIPCDFKRQPWILYTETGKKDETIEKEKKSLEKYGLEVQELEELPLPFKTELAIKIENQAQFNPSSFVAGLAEKIENENCRIYENTPVHHIKKGEPHVLH